MFKFRAKTINGKWVEGDLIDNNNVPIIIKRSGSRGSIAFTDMGHWYIDVPAFRIIPESLAISTGLFDKSGTEIFSSFPVNGVMSKGGDIVKSRDTESNEDIIGYVCYSDVIAIFLVWVENQSYYFNYSDLSRKSQLQDTQIIGNQFERKN